MDIEQRVSELVEEKINEIGRADLFLVSVKMLPNGKLIILVDGDKGIGIAECAQISRYVGFRLEEDNVIEEAYNLEVSSPGLDAPLTLPRQYVKNVGRTLVIKMADGSKREGKLSGLTEDAILVEESIKEKGKKAETVESMIPLTQITETKVVISFK
ncbi:MAG: ribosome maturation factor RimP [Sphingobacteriales bacterium]